jgi:TRAP-type C4-dicarboxylate transport system permease small subunit
MSSSSDRSRLPTWFRWLKKAEDRVVDGEKIVCALSLAVMAFATAFQVFARNAEIRVLNYGELGLAALIPLTLVGGAMCTALGSHVAVDVIQAMPSKMVKRVAEVLVALATLVFAYFYINSGIYLVEEFYVTGDNLLDLGTPLWILAAFFPIGMGLMAIHAVMRLLDVFFGTEEPRAVEVTP